MRGILEGELIEVRKNLAAEGLNTDAIDALITLKVRELQEPWMTLDEFLKKPKYEWCWIMLTNKQIHMAYISYNDSENYVFYLNDFDRDESYSLNEITHVMPIHKPEPPR